MARGRGGKAKRGGGHSFSKDLVLNEDGIEVSHERRGSARKRAEEDANRGSDDSAEESESTEEEEEEEEAAPQPTASTSEPQDPLALRAAKKAQKQAAKAKAAGGKSKAPGIGNEEGDEEEEDDTEDLINPNHATPKTFKAADLSAPKELNRREREAKDKKEAQDRYWKLHAAGKTEQAKTDLARLAAIRKQREEAAAQRKAETEAKAAEIEAKKAASKQQR